MGGAPVAKLNNVLMQMRKNCNHPDLIAGAFDGSLTYPSADELVAQVGAALLRKRTRLPACASWVPPCRPLQDRFVACVGCPRPQALFRPWTHGRLTGCAAAQCGKLALLDRILTRLHRDGHKVLIFSQVRGPAALPPASPGRRQGSGGFAEHCPSTHLAASARAACACRCSTCCWCLPGSRVLAARVHAAVRPAAGAFLAPERSRRVCMPLFRPAAGA